MVSINLLMKYKMCVMYIIHFNKTFRIKIKNKCSVTLSMNNFFHFILTSVVSTLNILSYHIYIFFFNIFTIYFTSKSILNPSLLIF